MRPNRPMPVALALMVAAVVLSSCGTTEPTADATERATDAAAARPVTVTDGRGEEVTLDRPASRVVALEWGQVEDVVTLGVQPVGVADVAGYTSWVSAAPLTGDPVDVGLRTEPSVESVADADPDLILGIVGSIPDGALAQMEGIAPVVLLTPADASDPLGQMKENFTATASLLGKQREAEQALADLDGAIDDGRSAVEQAGRDGTPFVFSYIYEEGNGFSLRMHGPGSQPIALATAVGLTPAWPEHGDAEWGLSTLDLEGLTRLPEGVLFTYWGNADTEDPLTSLDGNPLWESLPFVQAGDVEMVADGIWIYGGPASSRQWVEQVVQVATS